MTKKCVYIIKSKSNPKKCYVGSAIDFIRRQRQHISDLKLNRHSNTILQNHINKYGIDDVYFEVLEIITELDKLIEREQFYIDLISPTFNICQIANSSIGVKRSESTKQKLRKCKNALGVKRKESTLIKMRESMIGKNSGKKRTAEQNELNRQRMLGKNIREVIDTKTNIIYRGINVAALAIGKGYRALRAQLSGQNPNTTSLIYLK